MTKSWPKEPVKSKIDVKKGELYKATLTWRREGYKAVPLKDYFLKIENTMAYIYDGAISNFLGCFPLHWFKNFELVDEIPETEPVIEEEHFQLVLF